MSSFVGHAAPKVIDVGTEKTSKISINLQNDANMRRAGSPFKFYYMMLSTPRRKARRLQALSSWVSIGIIKAPAFHVEHTEELNELVCSSAFVNSCLILGYIYISC